MSKVKHAHFSVFKVKPPKGQATLLQIPAVEASLISISAFQQISISSHAFHLMHFISCISSNAFLIHLLQSLIHHLEPHWWGQREEHHGGVARRELQRFGHGFEHLIMFRRLPMVIAMAS